MSSIEQNQNEKKCCTIDYCAKCVLVIFKEQKLKRENEKKKIAVIISSKITNLHF